MESPNCFIRTCLVSMAVMAGASTLSPAATAAPSTEAPILRDSKTPLTPAQHRQLNAHLTQVAQAILAHVELLPGQSRQGGVIAEMDLGTNMITVYFQRSFLPSERDALLLEDQLDAFRHALTWEAWRSRASSGVRYLWAGRPLYDYFPGIRAEDERAREISEQASRSGSGSGVALVAAGHGFYFQRTSSKWALQRPLSFEIQEDFLTMDYAQELKQWIERRSQMPALRARSTSQDPHPATGEAWWKFAARYHLEQQYPQNPEIWNSLGAGSSNDHDYKEDIRSRPLLANHQRAEFLVHLHTNAAGPAATGTRVIYQPGREDGKRLAVSVLCYMKETIHAVEAYRDFTVNPQGEPSDKGENRLAAMPSIIVETAFHTNPTDALALQDPAFRTAAMKGVEKGIRLFREGRDCQPFTSRPIADLEVEHEGEATTSAVFKGYPQFPVTLTATNIACPMGWNCRGGSWQDEEAIESGLPLTSSCRNVTGTPGVITWEIILKDADGVTTAPQRFSVTCNSSPRGGGSSAVPSAALS